MQTYQLEGLAFARTWGFESPFRTNYKSVRQSEILAGLLTDS